MMNNVPLVGSLTAGFGDAGPMAPTAKTPNLKEASKDFVAMLYSYMFQQMRESGSDEENGLFSGEHANMLMGFLDQEVGKKMAHSESGGGLSTALLNQLKQAGGEDPDAASEAAQVKSLEAAGNTLRELTQDETPAVIADEADLDQQIMDELYKLNQR